MRFASCYACFYYFIPQLLSNLFRDFKFFFKKVLYVMVFGNCEKC